MSKADPTERFAVSAESESETKTVVEARDFEFVVDEPAALGGTNEGPNPVEYLIGAWAGCLNVVVHTVGEERGIDLDNVAIHIEGDLDPRKFLGIDETTRAGYQEVNVRIEVESDADEEALEALGAAVEERCPVGDNIENPTPTDVTLEAA
ncbi:OsmC family protein [Halorubrum aidingense JCM 13560]|uniref:OsmC family protein n=1 Tax=Halorubrum aidingense JCM 13560 TaxID=1230454 RepID=M0P748_9EURY|nr:OsmC family protein [Halorubrum aidingense]EMA65967.1 OsmC family protein [Halorubrum aidingense JCM 13560]